MKKLTGLLILSFFVQIGYAQFDPAAGMAGSRAVHKDSSAFIDWASACTIKRGWKDIAQKDSGKVDYGTVSYATKKSDGTVISLGDSGVATLSFNTALANGKGADFAIFENSFSDVFLELAFVEVSSDGVHFVRFPAISNVDTSSQIGSFGSTDPTDLYNFAGKYRAQYGVPFDLEELKDSANLNVDAVIHVRLIDVVGSIDTTHASRDSEGKIVNDPYPTLFPSGGFDLDAVGVIHNQNNTNTITDLKNGSINVYPTSVESNSMIQFKGVHATDYSISISDQTGRVIVSEQLEGAGEIRLPSLSSGVLFITVHDLNNNLKFNRKIIVQ
jgi:hypothetical protein